MYSNVKVKSRIKQVLLLFIIIQIIGIVLDLTVEVPSNLDQYVLILMPVIIVTLLMKVNIKERFKFNKFKKSSLGLIILLVILVMPVSMFISAVTDIVFGENPAGISSYVDSLNFGFVMLMFHLAVTPAICEELMFRGLLIDSKSGLSIHKLALLNGLMFGLFHVGFDQIFYCLWMGTVLGYVAIITNSIYPVMIIHFLNNAYAVIEILIDKHGGPTISGLVDTSSMTGMFILAMISVIAFVLVVFVIKRLMEMYSYNDKERLAQNSEDVEVHLLTNKLKVYWPLVLMGIYVLIINLLISSISSISSMF